MAIDFTADNRPLPGKGLLLFIINSCNNRWAHQTVKENFRSRQIYIRYVKMLCDLDIVKSSEVTIFYLITFL